MRRANRDGDFTHRAPAARRYRRAAVVVHTLPHFLASACTRYRGHKLAEARAGVWGSGTSPDSLPGAHGTVVFLLPLRIGDAKADADVGAIVGVRAK